MPRVLNNSLGVKATVLVTANDTFSPASLQLPGETLTGLHLSQVVWGVPGANSFVTISRGANTMLVLSQSGMMNLAQNGMSIQADPTANVTVTFTDTTVGSVVLVLQKVSQVTNPQY